MNDQSKYMTYLVQPEAVIKGNIILIIREVMT